MAVIPVHRNTALKWWIFPNFKKILSFETQSQTVRKYWIIYNCSHRIQFFPHRLIKIFETNTIKKYATKIAHYPWRPIWSLCLSLRDCGVQAAIYYSIGRPVFKRYLLCLSPSLLLKSQNKLERNSGNELFLKQSDLSARALVFLAAREKGTGRLLGRPLCTRKKRSGVLSHAQGTATHTVRSGGT
jgi:hypothetical protein